MLADGTERVVTETPPADMADSNESLSLMVRMMNSPVETLEEVLATSDIGEEQKALVLAGAWAKKLLDKPEYLQLLGSLIAFRRCYAVAYRELQDLMKAEPKAHPMTEDYIIQAAMHKAAQPFNEKELMLGFAQTALPWIESVVVKHSAKDEALAHEELKAEEDARRNRPMPLPFPIDLEGGIWHRDRSLVLIGWRNAVQYVIDQIVLHVLKTRTKWMHTVIWLGASYHKSKHSTNQLVWVGPTAWKGCGDTNDSMREMIVSHVVKSLSTMPDLVVCDDLTKTHTKGFYGRPEAAAAGDGHKRVRDWCNKAGCGMLGAVPKDSKADVDVKAPELEQLRTFTHLRLVRVIDKADNLAEGKCRIVVGTNLAYFDVDKELLDNYMPSTLIVPG